MKKKYKELIINSLIEGSVFTLTLLLGILILIYIAPQPPLPDHDYSYKTECNISDYEKMIDEIQEKCDSTHITTYKQPNQQGKYSVFNNVCKEDGYCKYDYTPLEDCLEAE